MMDEQSVGAYFAGLRSWEHSQAVLERFDRTVVRRTAPPPEQFFSDLYRHLLDYLLAAFALPASPGAAQWEWRPLYQLIYDLDPGYFTEQQIGERVAACGPSAQSHADGLTAVLNGFFRLRRDGFPSAYPHPLVSMEDSLRWWMLFPAEHAAGAVDVLRRAGLYPVASPEGWRSLNRFTNGTFDARLTASGLHHWQQFCSAPSGNGDTGDGLLSPHQADFLASAFAGRYAAFGWEGHCGAIPRCGECPLRQDCRWAGTSPDRSEGAHSVLARLAFQDPASLSDAHLLGAILQESGVEIASLETNLGSLSLRDLARMPRLEVEQRLEIDGPAATRVAVLLELCRRFGEERLKRGTPITSGEDVYNHFRMRLRDLNQEQFLVVMLDLRRRYVGETMVTQGLLDKSLVHPREVFHAAIRSSAAAVLLVHNHPSGNPAPSADDVEVTRRLVEAGRIVGISVLDHVIVADEGYTSLAENDLMPK